jgi:hypothetical protein
LQGKNVVKGLLQEFGEARPLNNNHFFTLMPLFMDLLNNGIMATSTLRANRK